MGRTVIMGVVGGTASALGGGKFANGAVSGAFVHMFNGEFDTLGKALKGLWSKKGQIVSDTGKGLKGYLHGYRQVRDNAPWYARGILKVGMTGVEMGATAGLAPELQFVYNANSGVWMDTIPTSPIGALSYGAAELTGYDGRWFK